MRRRSCPGGGGALGGLTMSEDGGLDEVEESFRAVASCASSFETVRWRSSSRACWASSCACWASNRARWASSCACNRWQFAQEGRASAPMAADSKCHTGSVAIPHERPPRCDVEVGKAQLAVQQAELKAAEVR